MGSAVSARVLLLGLDNAGKTSLNDFLTEGPNNNETEPSTAFNTSEKKLKGVKFDVYDVAGAKASRPLWKHYFEGTNGIVWVVDASDPDRFKESKDQLSKALKDATMPSGVPVLVAGTKFRSKSAVDHDELEAEFGEVLKDHEHQIHLMDTKTGENVQEGLEFLAMTIKADMKARKGK